MNASSAISRSLSFGYRPRSGPLQQARATASMGWCLALMLVVVLYENPLVLAAVAGAVLVSAALCRVLREVLFVLAISSPLVFLMAAINPIASQQGLTVLVEGIELPVFGAIDITQEAVNYGLVLGLRAMTIFAISGLYVCTVDPDELLRSLRRHSVRSAITASLAVRFVPVLARDAGRLSEARRCRPGPQPGAATMVRAVFSRSLDRAGDAALALETRGYAVATPLRERKRTRTRADRLVLTATCAIVAAAVAGKLLGAAGFSDYPLTWIATGLGDFIFAAAVAAVAVLPLSAIPAIGEGER